MPDTIIINTTATESITLTTGETPEITVNPLNVVAVNTAGAGSYTHAQSVPAALWTITHNLGFRPAGIVVLDSAGDQVFGDVEYTSLNSLTIDFGAGGFSGTAYLS